MAKFEETYEFLEAREIKECGGTGTLYRHKRTGARIFTLKTPDPNKVFLIGFRTTPKDSTGVAHIMEHSVLCGSEKFPIKDPFVELAKGSLNTFLNAMTYPDKTVYPVASCNEQDFMNLMDVYLDAVLHPNIYREEKIFRQEGWHYELESPADELKINGVVYNEMKGVFSSPESVLERYTMHALFPDTTYGFESGGDPEVIPKLSYDAFMQFHKQYYHPSNSYLYLYGDMDMEEKLLWIDAHYLSGYEYLSVDSHIDMQTPAKEAVRETVAYPIGDGESEEHHTYLSENYVVAATPNQELNLAWQILEFVLLDAPGAPLKEALIEAGIGEDILGGYTGGIKQPYFSVIAKNADASELPRFREIIRETLSSLVREGLDRKMLAAAINYTEFKLREADYGRMPAGLMYGLTALDSWLYEESPYRYLVYEEALQSLKARAKEGYFEELIRKSLLENVFRAEVSIVPKKGLTAERDAALAKELAEKKAALSKDALLALIEETKALKAYQEEETDPEDLKKLPVLKVNDISTEAEKGCLTEEASGLLYTDIETHGIAYVHVLFPTDALSDEELQFAAFLRYLLGEIDTEAYRYQDIASEILMQTGGIDFETISYPSMTDENAFAGMFNAELRVLTDRLPQGMALLQEILVRSRFTDEKRIGDKLLEAKSRMQMKLDGASHASAVCRAGSYFNRAQRFDDLTAGIAFYEFLNASAKLYQEPVHRKRWIRSLKDAAGKLFTGKKLVFALTGDTEQKEILEREMPTFTKALHDDLPLDGAGASLNGNGAVEEKGATEEKGTIEGKGDGTACGCAPLGNLNEGFETASQVNYVARCGSFRQAGLPYTGALMVLRMLLNYDYLWINLRVKGGAYGCMSGFAKSGRAYLVSYRDPHIARTNDIYDALPDYLAKLEISEEDLNKYIIGAISDLDQPVTASIRAQRELSKHFSGLTDADFQKERDEVLHCSREDLRALSPYLAAVLSQSYICAIGNAQKIREHEQLFRSVRALYT